VFDHVTVRASDRAATERFYLTVLGALGIEQSHSLAEFAEWDDFSLAAAASPSQTTRGLHIGFAAASREAVDEFWRAGSAAGHADDGAPGPRPQYREDYYGSFLLDPDGNSAEATWHGALRSGGVIDHVWIRVADPGSARAFYELLAAHAGLRVTLDDGERLRFSGDPPHHGSLSLVRGAPTRNAHIAFPAADDAAVRAFHRAMLVAGHRDLGAPGERASYHPGYYAAYVADPDGNNVELVNHNRG
jgi:catechol 2,3-dioxygenase-like lactoylglutathione lyase family enzyme